jgi:DNA modification methylase
MTNFVLHVGDCREVLAALPDASVDSVVTDPPYELGFMGKKWDAAGIAYDTAMWAEVLRVLKPGGHLLAFGGTRTYHRMTVAIEDAGFEIRDSLNWLYGSGFPKSLSVHKATLKAVESRYGTARCDCLDARHGQPDRLYVGRESRSTTSSVGSSGQEPPTQTGLTDLSVQSGGRDRDLRELRKVCDKETTGPETGAPSVLHSGVRGRRAETSGQRHSEVRAGMVEPACGDSAERQDLSNVRDTVNPDGSTSRSSFGSVQIRGNEPTGESGGIVRQLPSQDRSSNEPGVGHVVGGSDTRRVELDDHGGQQSAVARVCSWCGLPDRGWLDQIEPLGTALKPAHEPIVVARKPLVGTVAANVLAHGTGALNIDGCRVGTDGGTAGCSAGPSNGIFGDGLNGDFGRPVNGLGRWPANVVLTHHHECRQTGTTSETVGGGAAGTSGFAAGYETGDGFVGRDVPTVVWDCHPECPIAVLDGQSGISKDGVAVHRTGNKDPEKQGYGKGWGTDPRPDQGYGGQGGASRFFTQTEWDTDLDGPSFHYVAKPAKKERNLGLDLCKCDQPATTTSVTCDNCGNVKSGHPTVKPVALMRHLVRLVTPPGGTVLDPFTGSGTTGMAAMLEGCNFVGIEQSADYAENLATPRIEQARRMAEGPPPAPSPSQSASPAPDPDQPSLFD